MGIQNMLLKRFRGNAAIIFTNHSSMFLEYASDPANARALRKDFSLFDAIIAPSNELKERTEEFYPHPGRVFYVPNAVDGVHFSPGASTFELSKDYGVPRGAELVLCPRRIVRKNGLEFLVRALAGLKEDERRGVRFAIVGNGVEDEEVRLRSLADNLRVSDLILWMGVVPNDQMVEFYRASTFVVIPSLMEATSIAALEAMACGKAVIASKVGGLPDIIADGVNGYLVPPADPEALLNSIRSMLSDKRKVSEMGTNARQIVVEKFSWHEVGELVEKIYRGVMTKNIDSDRINQIFNSTKAASQPR